MILEEFETKKFKKSVKNKKSSSETLDQDSKLAFDNCHLIFSFFVSSFHVYFSEKIDGGILALILYN